MQKAKWLSEEALQIAEKRREAKSKREREKYTQLEAEDQRITRRNQKPFFKEQCKGEENNRMKKTRDIFNKILDIKRTLHATMGMIKIRNGKNLNGS